MPSPLKGWKDHLLALSIQPVQQFAYTSGKNSTDTAMIIDAMDLLYSKRFDGFCLVSSDSDFTRLAGRIRESGVTVFGFGEQKTPKPFVAACDKFIYVENLGYAEGPAAPSSAPVPMRPVSSAHQLKGNTALVSQLRNAIEAASDDDGWAALSNIGHIILKQHPDFDPRTYGCSKLSDLVSATTLFELDRRSPGEGNRTSSTPETTAAGPRMTRPPAPHRPSPSTPLQISPATPSPKSGLAEGRQGPGDSGVFGQNTNSMGNASERCETSVYHAELTSLLS